MTLRSGVIQSPFSATRSRLHPSVCTRRSRCAAQQRQPEVANKYTSELLSTISNTERGLVTTSEQSENIKRLVNELQSLSAGAETTTPKLSATWKLLWTTEKETLFILKNAKLFGTKAGEVYQVIDTATNSLQNVITFPPSGAFIVNSDIKVTGPQRVTFKFTNATFKVSGKDTTLPPFGQGWFDTVYMDDKLRIAKDIRGDTLIVERDGPPKVFA